ncbi:MAG: outer membrane beta-barrel protein [Bacteroidota bacterium]
MKLRIIYFRQVLLTALIVIYSQHEVFSQDVDSSAFKRQGMFVGFSLAPSQSQIVNAIPLAVSDHISDKKYSFPGSVEFGYFFSKFFGLSSGIGFNSYGTQLTLDTYQNKYNALDSENESYERRVSGSGIKEEQNIGFLSVPICINIRLHFSKTIGFFLQPGVTLLIPLSKSYKSSGTFTYKGYYSSYNVLLEDIPAYGFPSNVSSEFEGKLELKQLNFNAVVSAGFDFFIQKKIQIAIAACYDKSLSGISKYSSTDDFQLSSDVNQINSLMGGSSKATVQSMGVKIILRYYLK